MGSANLECRVTGRHNSGALSLQVEVSTDNNGTRVARVFAPLWVVNATGRPLTVRGLGSFARLPACAADKDLTDSHTDTTTGVDTDTELEAGVDLGDAAGPAGPPPPSRHPQTIDTPQMEAAILQARLAQDLLKRGVRARDQAAAAKAAMLDVPGVAPMGEYGVQSQSYDADTLAEAQAMQMERAERALYLRRAVFGVLDSQKIRDVTQPTMRLMQGGRLQLPPRPRRHRLNW